MKLGVRFRQSTWSMPISVAALTKNKISNLACDFDCGEPLSHRQGRKSDYDGTEDAFPRTSNGDSPYSLLNALSMVLIDERIHFESII